MNPTIHKWTTNPQIPFGGTREDEKGSIMEIVLNGMVYTTLIDETTGKWSWIPELPLADGPYTVSTRVIDKAGNANAPTQVILHVDTTAPNKPDILRVVDDEGLQQGWLTPGAKTDDKTPTLSGNAEPGSIVRLYDGSNEIGSALTDQSGHWEITPITELPNGTHRFTVTSTDPMGHTSDASDAFSLTIENDGEPPIGDGATITHASDNVGSATGTLLDGAITDDTTPTLNGTAKAGSTVRIQYRAENGSWIAGGNAVLNGTDWTWTPNPALAEGKYEFRANDGSGWTDEFRLDIDLTPGDRYEITHAYDDFGTYTGELSSGAITDDRTPTLHGRGEANSVVYIHYHNVLGAWELLASVIVGADGQWKYDSDRLAPGNYEFSAEKSAVHDADAKSFGLKIVAEGSFAPTIDGAFDDAGPVTGIVKHNGITDDTTPTLTGTAEANSLVVISYKSDTSSDNAVFTVRADSRGNWTFTPDELTLGVWKFNVKYPEGNFLPNDYNLSIVENDSITYSYGFEDKTPMDLSKDTSYFLTENISLKLNNGDAGFSEPPASFMMGKRTLYTKDGSQVEFNLTNTTTFSFDIGGADYGTVIISVYDTSNTLLSQKTYNLPDANVIGYSKHTHFSFDFNNQLIGKVVINTHDDAGFYIDNLKWSSSSHPNQISEENNHDNALLVVDDSQHLSLSIADVLASGQQDLYIDDGKTHLMVNGKAGDILQLEDILPEGSETSGWTALAGTVTIAGCEYQVYSNGDAELLVQDGVKTELV